MYHDRPELELTEQAEQVHAQAQSAASFHDLGCITICYTADGAFRVLAGLTNCSFAVGLLTRAAGEIHAAHREQCPTVILREPPKTAGGIPW